MVLFLTLILTHVKELLLNKPMPQERSLLLESKNKYCRYCMDDQSVTLVSETVLLFLLELY